LERVSSDPSRADSRDSSAGSGQFSKGSDREDRAAADLDVSAREGAEVSRPAADARIDLFPIVSGPLLLEEQKARDDARNVGAELQASDRRAYQEFIRGHAIAGKPRFEELPVDAQRAYYALWRDSPSVVKRAFHSTMKTLVMTTFYSADDVWPSIGYAGPLIHRGSK
jgi:hypothetical protein